VVATAASGLMRAVTLRGGKFLSNVAVVAATAD